MHSILVEEPLVIEQLHRQTYPLEVVEMVVKEVKSIQYSLKFLAQQIHQDFESLSEAGFKILGHPQSTQTLYKFIFHLKVLSHLI